MDKKYIVIILGLLLLTSIFLFFDKSNTVDWSVTYNEEGTNPMDTKVFFEQLPNWFNNQKITKLYTTFYEFEKKLTEDEFYEKRNYISISGDYNIDKPSFESLLNYIKKGNQALIVAHNFPQFMKDTLGFELGYNNVVLSTIKKGAYLNHRNDSLYFTQKNPFGDAFVNDSINVKQLGYSYNEFCEEQSNFVGIPYYNGIFYLHTTPELFTNYQLLEAKKSTYWDHIMSFLPELPVLFEKNIKIDPALNNGPLSFILSKPALHWAFYIALITILIFMLFTAKRKQRIIPIIQPLKNTTTEFVQTVSTLHLESEDYNGIIQKNINYFLEHVRNHFYLPTDNLNSDFIKKLAQKSGKSLDETERLITLIIKMKAHTFSTPDPLKKLNTELENFYKKS